MRVRQAFLFVALAAVSADAAVTVTTPFRGITDTHVSQPATTGALDFHVLKIDLSDPAIAFATTPSSGSGVPSETTRQTTRQFVQQTGAQVGINANFYDNTTNPFGPTTTLIGLAASNGAVVSQWSGLGQNGLNLSATNVATIIEPDPANPTGTANTAGVTPYNAIAGFARLVRGGVVATIADAALAPRTAAGVDADGNLILMVVDGRQPGRSDGMTQQQLADTMKFYGAVDAFNLDGGGSSTLVYADTTPRVVNVPASTGLPPGVERTNGNNLAIFAAPVPEPTGLLAGVVLAAVALRRRRVTPAPRRA